MREILFRGKRIDNGEWVHGHYAKFADGWVGILYGTVWDEVIPETVGQFTGLTDKNGVKIFEHNKVKDESGEVWIVAYYENAFCLVQKLMPELDVINDVMLMHLIDWSELEVIGNIHEGNKP